MAEYMETDLVEHQQQQGDSKKISFRFCREWYALNTHIQGYSNNRALTQPSQLKHALPQRRPFKQYAHVRLPLLPVQ